MDQTPTQPLNDTAVSTVAEASPVVESAPTIDNTSDAAFEALVANQNTAPAVESEPVSAPAPAVEEVATPAPTETAPERQPQSKAQQRIRDLVEMNKQLREQISSNPVSVPTAAPQPPKLSELVQADEYGNVQPEQLDQAGQKLFEQAAQSADAKASLELQQLRNELKLRDAIAETDSVAKELGLEYPELNPSSPDYNPALESKIARRYQQEAVRTNPQTGQKFFDPSIKLADVAKDEVQSFHEAVEYGKTQAQNSISNQIDSSAITPDASAPAPEKNFDDMSLSEQESYLRAKGHNI